MEILKYLKVYLYILCFGSRRRRCTEYIHSDFDSVLTPQPALIVFRLDYVFLELPLIIK